MKLVQRAVGRLPNEKTLMCLHCLPWNEAFPIIPTIALSYTTADSGSASAHSKTETKAEN